MWLCVVFVIKDVMSYGLSCVCFVIGGVFFPVVCRVCVFVCV